MGALKQIGHLRDWFRSNSAFTTASLMIVLTIGGEILVESEFFRCPCPKGEAFDYTLTFALVPAALLFFASVLVNSTVWRNCYGCCKKDCILQDTFCCGWIGFSLYVVMWSLLPIGCWAIVLLLDGDYLACASTDDPCVRQDVRPKYAPMCAEALQANQCAKARTDEYKWWARTSQYIGWSIFGGVALLGLLILLCKRSCTSTPRTYLGHQFEEAKKNAEEALIMGKMKRYAGYIKDDECEETIKRDIEAGDLKDYNDKEKKENEAEKKKKEENEIYFTQIAAKFFSQFSGGQATA